MVGHARGLLLTHYRDEDSYLCSELGIIARKQLALNLPQVGACSWHKLTY
jgi:hypothetical protein